MFYWYATKTNSALKNICLLLYLFFHLQFNILPGTKSYFGELNFCLNKTPSTARAWSAREQPGFQDAPDSLVQQVEVRAPGCPVPATVGLRPPGNQTATQLPAQVGEVTFSGVEGGAVLGQVRLSRLPLFPSCM